METIFMNTENRKSSNKHVALQNLSIYYMWKTIEKQYKNKKLKIMALTWNYEFGLPDGSYFVSSVQDYINYNMKKHKTLTIPPIHAYINRFNDRLAFKIKDRFKLQLQMAETRKLFGSTKILTEKTKNSENVPSLEVVEVVLVQCK